MSEVSLRMRAQKRDISSELAPRSSKNWASLDTWSRPSTSAIASASSVSVSDAGATWCSSALPAPRRPVGGGQAPAVDLVAGQHRDRVQLLEVGRHHVGGQPLAQRALQAVVSRSAARARL